MKINDIRDQAHLSGEAVRQLNFIKASDIYEFRKYYRSGLRSHIFEVLLKTDVEKENAGILEDGIRIFPRAVPKKMFRIFRSRFSSKEEIFREIQHYNILLTYLGDGFIARSEEFITDYRVGETSGILLCGLQEYVAGEILDPWRLNSTLSIRALLETMPGTGSNDRLLKTALDNIRTFTTGIRQLIADTGIIPDLAGVGNLILTPAAGICLVDINNIVPLKPDDTIHLDDKGYPACDVSVQVLFILEKELLGIPGDDADPLHRIFLNPERKARVKKIEQAFYRQLGEQA